MLSVFFFNFRDRSIHNSSMFSYSYFRSPHIALLLDFVLRIFDIKAFFIDLRSKAFSDASVFFIDFLKRIVHALAHVFYLF